MSKCNVYNIQSILIEFECIKVKQYILSDFFINLFNTFSNLRVKCKKP